MRQKKNQTVPSNARKNVNKCDNMQMVDKQTQRELIKRKAQQLLKDNETVSSMKQMKMNTVSVNYKLDFPNNTQCDTGLVSENMDSQINTLNKKINALEEEIDEKNKEIDNLQLSLVLANSNIDALRIEVDEVYTLLESCTEKNNELKKKLEALESTNVDKSNTQGNVLESPVRSTVVSIKSKKLFDSPTMVQEEDSIPCTSSLTPPMKVNNKLLHRTPPTMFEGEENAVPSASSSTPMKVKENKSAVTTTPSLKGCTQKNSKKIKKHKWLKHTLYDYDSDDYASDLKTAGKEKNHEDFTAFQITNNDGHNEKMFHLCYGYCIKYEEWKSIRSQPTASRFINKLAIALWGEREMVLRAIDLRRAESRRDRDTPRKAVTPKKAGILRKCYRQYLLTKHEIKQKDLEKLNQNNLSKNHKKNLLKKLDGWTTHLSNAINQVYNQEKAKDKDDDSSPSSEDDKGSNRAVDLDSDN